MNYQQFISRKQLQFGDFALSGVSKNYAPDLKLEPTHTEIHLTVNIEERHAVGYAIITIKANIDGAHSLDLDAVDFEDISVESLDGKALSHTYDDKHIALDFNYKFKTGEETRIRINYSVQDPITGLQFSKPDEQRPNFPLYAITDNETERGRYWFPCVDFPTIRPTMEYYLTADESLTILANGSLMSEDSRHGLKTAHWKLDAPCPSYLACFAIGDFSVYQDEPHGDMPIAYFADSSYTPEQLKRTFGATRKMLVWIEKKLGMKFPYPKYFQVAGREIGGAMENISLVTWDDRYMLDENMARELQYKMDLVNVHEMSHSYFGDTIVSYDFAHVWLKESWATYIESVWLEDSEGLDAMHWQLAEEAREYMNEVKNRYARPIITREYDHSWNMFDMHLYPGGAWRLHMLRQLVGDENFWAGVQNYVNTYTGRTVKSLDFQRCIERHSGLNLDGFFDMWFHSKGYPVLKASFEYDKEKSRGKFTFEQIQEDKENGIELFEMDLEVAWQTEDQQNFVETIRLSKKQEVIYIRMDQPKHLILDPNMKALFEAEFNPGDDKLRHLLQHGKTVRGLMQAISELAKTGKRKNLQAIRDYLETETRWGLRIHAYRAIGKVGNDYAYQHLAELLIAENNPMALEDAASACGEHRNKILRQAILQKLDEKDLPYRGQMTLLSSLGKQQQAEDVELLKKYSQTDGWRNLVRAGAYAGLGASRTLDGAEILLQGVEDPVHFYDEKVARILALAAIHDWLPSDIRKRVAQALCEATQDVSYFVQINTARALGSAQIKMGIPYLEALQTQVAEQDRPLLKRQILSIQKSGEETGEKKLQKQLDELKTELGAMEKRLQEVEPEK